MLHVLGFENPGHLTSLAAVKAHHVVTKSRHQENQDLILKRPLRRK